MIICPCVCLTRVCPHAHALMLCCCACTLTRSGATLPQQVFGSVVQFGALSWAVAAGAASTLTVWAVLKLMSVFRVAGGAYMHFYSSTSAYSAAADKQTVQRPAVEVVPIEVEEDLPLVAMQAALNMHGQASEHRNPRQELEWQVLQQQQQQPEQTQPTLRRRVARAAEVTQAVNGAGSASASGTEGR